MNRTSWLPSFICCLLLAAAATAAPCTESGCRLSGDTERAVVRVVHAVNGNRSCGSGTLVRGDDGEEIILTCGHLFRGPRGEVTVTFYDGRRFEAEVLAVDQRWDLAALAIVARDAAAVKIAVEHPRPGEPLRSCGYGSDGRYWCNPGQALGYARTAGTSTHETLQLSGFARQGDSGGPVLNREGELVAVIWGTDGRSVMGTYCGRIRQFLDHLVRPCVPRPERPGVVPVVPIVPVAPAVPVDPAAPAEPVPGPVDTRPFTADDRQQAIQQQLKDLAGVLEDTNRRIGEEQQSADRRTEKIEEALTLLIGLKSRIEEVPAALDLENVRSVIREAAAGVVASGVAADQGSGLAQSLLPGVLAALGWTGPPAIAAIVALRLASGLIRRRRRKRAESGGAAGAAAGFFHKSGVGTIPRDDQEAAQFLRLSQLEGRSPLHDALVGRIALDEIQNTMDAKPDGPEVEWARTLKQKLEDRFNQMAPAALVVRGEG